MIKQFPNISSWRQYEFIVKANDVYTLNFRDTLPNIFVINNPNMSFLKIGISTIPRHDSYEFKVDYNSNETIGRPVGTNNLYILNDSPVDAKITVFSIEKEFDPTILKNMNVSMDGHTIDADITISNIVEGLILPVHDSVSKKRLDDIVSLLGSIDSTLTALYELKEDELSGV